MKDTTLNALTQEWVTLQHNHERYEHSALLLRGDGLAGEPLLHENHARPVTRRQMLGAGLLSAPAMVIGPAWLGALLKAGNAQAGGPGLSFVEGSSYDLGPQFGHFHLLFFVRKTDLKPRLCQ